MGTRSEKSKRSKDSMESDDGWDCPMCTYKNPRHLSKCEMCLAQKGTSTRRGVANPQFVHTQLELEINSKTKKRPTNIFGGRRARGTSAVSETHSSSEFSEVRSPNADATTVAQSTANITLATVAKAPVKRKVVAHLEEDNVTPFDSAAEALRPDIHKPTKRRRPRKSPSDKICDAASTSPGEGTSRLSVIAPSSLLSGPFRVFTIIHDGLKIDFEELILSEEEDLSDDE